ncbi:MAG TPA: hypothetical protein PKW18_03790 [Candidatus Sumerlaeota bacterium]|nr:hypothetical protein [Candidatus Sumerlaeota bacterium]HON50495.1 hypothetical protein [Candidatus Sumerlaeota bacterium]HOR63710.1 hypothetical protein [Candidatus Sumerlaeota bacterium]HPL73678.1 hypothetical protein [Candidatus Sumerlaeota bacterium]HRU53301.1 hypothetical protein [Candidatus Sumerlaeia bacterium]
MRKLTCALMGLLAIIAISSFAQETRPLPQGEGYSIKKDAPNPFNRWEIKLSSPRFDRVIINQEAFYSRKIPENLKKPEAPEATVTNALSRLNYAKEMDAYNKALSKAPIERSIKYEPAKGSQQLDAFLEAYNQALQSAPRDEPIEYVIYRACWQYWYNQMELWEKYIQNQVFLTSGAKTRLDGIDYANINGVKTTTGELVRLLKVDGDNISIEDKRRNDEFLARLEYRNNRREDFKGWLLDQKAAVQNFTSDWIDRREGRELTIDGTIYLVSDKPLDAVPIDAVNVVTNVVQDELKVTPYDILNDDGSLRKPEK